jgi:hypothetical protein
MSDVLKGLSVPQLPLEDEEQREWNRDLSILLTNILNRINQSNIVSLNNFTPAHTADTRGTVGSMTYDDTYLYVKTSAGWKRTSLNIVP